MYQDNFTEPTYSATVAETEPELENQIPEIIEDEEQATDNIVIGIVNDCVKLNVREEPNKESAIVCELALQTEVMVDQNESTEDFYKVCTTAGIEGFCMKQFIAIQ